jgi:hypothetical protein
MCNSQALFSRLSTGAKSTQTTKIKTKTKQIMKSSNLKSIISNFNIHACLLPAALCLALCGCGTARISRRREIAVAPTAKPTIIYVADFQLNSATVKSRAGLLPTPPALPGPLRSVVPPLPGTPRNAHTVAREVVDQMAVSLVKDLNQAGLKAQRLSTNATMPSSGWLVRGVFTDVDQGNQLSRAIIGFGSGKTDLQVSVDLDDLSKGAPTPFYEMNTVADSGKAPGAGPTFAAAARLVFTGKDLDRTVKQTASQIAAEIVQRTQTTTVASAGQ